MAIQPAAQQQQVADVSAQEKAAAPFRFTFVGRVASFSEKDGVNYLSFQHAEKSYGIGMPGWLNGESLLKTVSEAVLPENLALKSIVRVTGRAAVFSRISKIADNSGPRGATKDAEFSEFRFVTEKIEVLPANGK